MWGPSKPDIPWFWDHGRGFPTPLCLLVPPVPRLHRARLGTSGLSKVHSQHHCLPMALCQVWWAQLMVLRASPEPQPWHRGKDSVTGPSQPLLGAQGGSKQDPWRTLMSFTWELRRAPDTPCPSPSPWEQPWGSQISSKHIPNCISPQTPLPSPEAVGDRPQVGAEDGAAAPCPQHPCPGVRLSSAPLIRDSSLPGSKSQGSQGQAAPPSPADT